MAKKISAKAQATTRRWPNERNVMFRPERLQYVRQKNKGTGCVFCRALVGKPSQGDGALVLAKRGSGFAILNKFPYNNAHILVLPTRHVGQLSDLSQTELLDLQILLQISIRAIEHEYKPDGFNVGLNLGRAAGAGLPDHLHWHLIPRWSGDVNFFPLIAHTKVVVESLEQTAARLRPLFQDQAEENL